MQRAVWRGSGLECLRALEVAAQTAAFSNSWSCERLWIAHGKTNHFQLLRVNYTKSTMATLRNAVLVFDQFSSHVRAYNCVRFYPVPDHRYILTILQETVNNSSSITGNQQFYL